MSALPDIINNLINNMKTDISDIGKTNAPSLNKRGTENALLNQTLALNRVKDLRH